MNGLTRAELIEMICPTDATYDCNQGKCLSSCDKCEDILNYLLDRYDAKVRADALNEYATMLMCVFSHSCEFYFISDDWTIEAIEKEKIDDVILKCLAKVREDKGGNDGNSINN